MSIRQVIDDIRAAGLEVRVTESRSGLLYKPMVEVRVAKTQYAVRGLLPDDDTVHRQFAKGLIDQARNEALNVSAGRGFRVGKLTNAAASEISLIDKSN